MNGNGTLLGALLAAADDGRGGVRSAGGGGGSESSSSPSSGDELISRLLGRPSGESPAGLLLKLVDIAYSQNLRLQEEQSSRQTRDEAEEDGG